MFRIGQKIICIDDSGNVPLVKGKIYTIKSLDILCECGTLVNVGILNTQPRKYPTSRCIRCKKDMHYPKWWGFRISRFAPLNENFAEDVLLNISEKVKEEQLTEV